MSGRKSRNKGAVGEREAAQFMTQLTGAEWRRAVGQYRHGADLPDVEMCEGETPVWVEVKRGKAPSWRAAMRQAKEATDGRPVVVLTRDDHGQWTMHAEQAALRALLRAVAA